MAHPLFHNEHTAVPSTFRSVSWWIMTYNGRLRLDDKAHPLPLREITGCAFYFQDSLLTDKAVCPWGKTFSTLLSDECVNLLRDTFGHSEMTVDWHEMNVRS